MTTDERSWQQEALVPPRACKLRFECYIVGPLDTIAVTWTMRDEDGAELTGMGTFGATLDAAGRVLVTERMAALVYEATRRLAPF